MIDRSRPLYEDLRNLSVKKGRIAAQIRQGQQKYSLISLAVPTAAVAVNLAFGGVGSLGLVLASLVSSTGQIGLSVKDFYRHETANDLNNRPESLELQAQFIEDQALLEETAQSVFPLKEGERLSTDQLSKLVFLGADTYRLLSSDHKGQVLYAQASLLLADAVEAGLAEPLQRKYASLLKLHQTTPNDHVEVARLEGVRDLIKEAHPKPHSPLNLRLCPYHQGNQIFRNLLREAPQRSLSIKVASPIVSAVIGAVIAGPVGMAVATAISAGAQMMAPLLQKPWYNAIKETVGQKVQYPLMARKLACVSVFIEQKASPLERPALARAIVPKASVQKASW